jgi:hypothetical protein
MESPKDSHWKVGKRILRYIAGTTTYVFWYIGSEENILIGYIDNDFASSIDDMKNTFGYVFFFGKKLFYGHPRSNP